MKSIGNKIFLRRQKKKLDKKREELEEKLGRFGKKNKFSQTDWLTDYPNFANGRPEEEADEVEEYDNLLSLNYVLEKDLERVLSALDKLKKGTYGICEKCRGAISKERLKIYPQAKYCLKCQKT